MTINNFEENIDTRLLERGLQYYQEGNILTIEQIDQGLWEAIVAGSENYHVTIELKDEKIIRNLCSCPFNLGEYCKHQVAIFNFLKYSDLAKNPHSGKIKKVHSIIDNFSPKKLKNALLDILKENKNLRDEFLQKEST
ncbi:MAG: SWIM zinc finger domain-containing protein [Saprospiraceae bacterium]